MPPRYQNLAWYAGFLVMRLAVLVTKTYVERKQSHVDIPLPPTIIMNFVTMMFHDIMLVDIKRVTFFLIIFRVMH